MCEEALCRWLTPRAAPHAGRCLRSKFGHLLLTVPGPQHGTMYFARRLCSQKSGRKYSTWRMSQMGLADAPTPPAPLYFPPLDSHLTASIIRNSQKPSCPPFLLPSIHPFISAVLLPPGCVIDPHKTTRQPAWPLSSALQPTSATALCGASLQRTPCLRRMCVKTECDACQNNLLSCVSSRGAPPHSKPPALPAEY